MGIGDERNYNNKNKKPRKAEEQTNKFIIIISKGESRMHCEMHERFGGRAGVSG